MAESFKDKFTHICMVSHGHCTVINVLAKTAGERCTISEVDMEINGNNYGCAQQSMIGKRSGEGTECMLCHKLKPVHNLQLRRHFFCCRLVTRVAHRQAWDLGFHNTASCLHQCVVKREFISAPSLPRCTTGSSASVANTIRLHFSVSNAPTKKLGPLVSCPNPQGRRYFG